MELRKYECQFLFTRFPFHGSLHILTYYSQPFMDCRSGSLLFHLSISPRFNNTDKIIEPFTSVNGFANELFSLYNGVLC